MRIADSLKCRLMVITAVALTFSLSLTFPNPMQAQQGTNAVCSGSAPAGITCSGSSYDASAFAGTSGNTDICAKINAVLTKTSPAFPTVGGVVDARGVTNLTCPSGDTPWSYGTSVSSLPSVILLPAGSIVISTTWVLPNYTRIYGEGQRGNPGASGTVIEASGTFTSGMPMIQFGASTVPPAAPSCTAAPLFGISIQDVMLDGNSQDIIGILNECAQETSYVDRVNLYEITGTGLFVSSVKAQNSGPYSNIVCNPGSSSLGSATTCVNLNGTLDLRGVHGLTATVGSNSICPGSTCPAAAVYLDSNSTSIEDAHFEGFSAGILVGANASAKGDVIFNVNGGGSTLTGPTVNIVEISSATTSGNPNVSDLSLMGATAASNPTTPNPNTIEDLLTGPTLADAHVALYAIGDPIGSSGYSRFTTSTSNVAPTWGAGGGAPGSGACKTGSLYSNTTGSPATLYLCKASLWVAID